MTPTKALALLGLAAVSCSDGDLLPPIQNRVTLAPFAGCTELEQFIEDTAVQEMRAQIRAEKEGTWYWRGGFASEGDVQPTAASAGENSPAPPSHYTTTNTQVSGVDEADFMKNDGTRIFVLSGQKLYAAKSWPAQDLALASSLPIEGYPHEMFLDDKGRLVIFSQVWTSWYDPKARVPACIDSLDCSWSYSNTSKVTVIDAKNEAALQVIDEIYLPGNYSSARRIGASVRMVLSDSFHWPSTLRFYPDYDPNQPNRYQDKGRLNQALDTLADENEKLLRARTLAEWLPRAKHRVGGNLVDLPYRCGDFYSSNAPERLGLVTVATLNLDKPGTAPARTSVLGEAGQIYASSSSLYVASPHWWWWPAPGQSNFTYLHKFDLTDPDRAPYIASGGVAGTLLNQFSLDEHQGFLRIATTIDRRVVDWGHPESRWGRTETTNRVYVLGEQSGALHIVGQTPEIAPGERLYSSRFLGAHGFLVTFRQVDPFFTLDLSDPTHPHLVGELKIPGFSTYLHPLDDNHLLTMGTYLPEPVNGHTDWSQRRMKINVFDVSDFTAPKVMFEQLVGTSAGWTEAAWQHKAFNWFPERKLLAIPFSDYAPNPQGNYWTSFVSDLRLFSIDLQTGITPRGSLSMRDLYISHGRETWNGYYSPWIRRSVMASDQAGHEFVYAISDAGIRAAAVESLQSPLQTVLFSK